MTDIINIDTKDKVEKKQEKTQLQVVKCLKLALDLAEQGKFEGIAMTLKRVDTESCTCYSGGKISSALIGGFENLKFQLCNTMLQNAIHNLKDDDND